MPTITLAAVDTAHHELTKKALEFSSRVCAFSKIVFISDKKEGIPNNWDFYKIGTFTSGIDYNQFILKDLNTVIDTDFVILVQYDGFILDGSCWDSNNLSVDYIGAVWPWHTAQGYAVGNGGFTLRSKKLLQALQDKNIELQSYPNTNEKLEDVTICRFYRSYLEIKYDIKFASNELASKFSTEYPVPGYSGKSFGFHGFHNLYAIYNQKNNNFNILVDNIQPYVWKRIVILQLAIQYLNNNNMQYEAKVLINKMSTFVSEQEMLKLFLQIGGKAQDFPHVWELRNLQN